MKSSDYSISQLKAIISNMDESSVEELFEQEARIGALKLKSQRLKQIDKEQILKQQYYKMLQYENKYSGKVIAGVDEVGRGPLAGPVVACAVILDASHAYYGLNDSKQMSKSARAQIESQLVEQVTYSIGTASVEEIDTMNIYEATKVAMLRAIESLPVSPDVLLIDAMKLNTGLIEESIIKGDANSVSIAAASVIAKEYRDQLMAAYALQYPGYDFEHNAGYGTKNHLTGINNKGITPIHRKSFEPIKSMVNQK